MHSRISTLSIKAKVKLVLVIMIVLTTILITLFTVSRARAHADVRVELYANAAMAVSAIVASAFIMVRIVNTSLKPIEDLAKNARAIAAGNIDVVFNMDSCDEVSEVSRSFMEIVSVLQKIKFTYEHAEDMLLSGEQDFWLEEANLGGIYDEIFSRTNNIIHHIMETKNSSKAKTDFLAKMSHEIRTPLNAIIGMAELVLREQDLSPTVREQASTIKHSSGYLLSIINDILDLAKVESGNLELSRSEFCFHSTVQDVISIMKMRISNPEVRFVVYMQHDIPNDMYGDEVRLRQVLLNLLSNAQKYTQKGHFALEITALPIDNRTISLNMSVRDTGIGLKPEDLANVFGEFAQFDREKNKAVEGTGLGLPISHNIVKLMGGEIKVASEYGVGSDFTISYPQQFIRSDDSPPAFPDKKVLLYCRNELNEGYIARSLSDLNVYFTMVHDDSDLHNKLQENVWDFVFAEDNLANTAQHIIRTSNLKSKVIMLSDSYDATYEVRTGHDISVLVMPAYLLPLVGILSGKDMTAAESLHTADQFIAPTAKVLIVDDIATNLRVGSGILKLYQIDADTCLSGAEAIAAIKAKDYDLVFMDHMMPDMDGIEATAHIRALGGKYETMPIVALTANAIVGAKEMFIQNGFNDFVSKPIEIGKFATALNKWLPEDKIIAACFIGAKAEKEVDFVIPGVDVARGLVLSGRNMQNYLEILNIYRKDCKAKANQIIACLASEDLKLYTTHVHALKSASANIGAIGISEDAKILEAAGIKGDKKLIRTNTGRFLMQLDKLLDDIGIALNENGHGAEADTSDIDMEEVKAQLSKLKVALESFDVGSIDAIVEELQKSTALPEVGPKIEAILQNAFIGQYNEAVLGIDEMV